MINGTTFESELDQKRLVSQLERVKELMQDGEWRTLHDIAEYVSGSEAGVSARLRDLRNKFGMIVDRRRVGRPECGLFEYRVAEFQFDGKGQGVLFNGVD